ncbi:acyl-CoA/acyl-ACP dehydrogenase [bacterium]|nr:acyl-CoA/acyl-ACP dehydrogenase [bacterium]
MEEGRVSVSEEGIEAALIVGDDVGRDVARHATEVHGGMGFTDLVGLHYWWKRVDTNRQLLGTPERNRHEAARAQGWVSA